MYNKKIAIFSRCIISIILILIVSNSSFAEKRIVIRYSHVQSPSSPTGQAAEFFKSWMENHSKGNVSIEIYPSGQLYNDSTEVDALVNGNIEMISTYMGKLTPYDVSLQFCLAPFLFKSPEQMAAFYDTNKDLVFGKLESHGITVKSFFFAGSQYFMSNNKEIKAPSDLKGLKVREGGGKMIAALYDILGASVTTVPYSELYTAMQTKLVDVVVTSIDGAVGIKLQETIKHVAMFDHIMAPYVIMMNKETFDSYPSEIQQLINKGLTAAQSYQFQKVRDLTSAGLETMAKTCQIFYPSEKEKDALKNVWFPVVEQHVDKKILDAIKAFVGK